jgi:hypothetical protein
LDFVDKAAMKMVDLAELLLDLAETGIDDGGQLKTVVEYVNRSDLMGLIWIVGGCELIAVLLFFAVASIPSVRAKLSEFGGW